MFVGLAVSLMRRLVFYLVPCSSSGACGLHCLPCRRFPLWVSAFSDTVCLPYSCAGGVGWATTLPLCYQCFSCTGWLAGVRWVLHPVSGSSHRGCDCSLGDSVVVLFGSTCLWGFVCCSVVSSCGSQPLWGLCSVHCLLSLALGWVCFWLKVSMAPVRCEVCNLGCPSWLVLLLRSLFVLHLLLRWGGLVTCLWPLLLLQCVGLLWGSLLRRSVALGSCAPSPAGSSLEDSSGFMVQAPGVFLDSFPGFSPLASGGYWLLGVVLR